MKRLHFLLTLLLTFIISGFLYAQNKNIYFVYDVTKIDSATKQNGDQPVMDFLKAEGFNVVPITKANLGGAAQSRIDSLNSAGLVIIGRSCTSTDFQSPSKEVWDSIKTPVLSMNLWALRSSRLNWFKTANAANVDSSFSYTFMADIKEPTDPVFEGITSPVKFITGPYSTIDIKDAGNGKVLATATVGGTVLFARFEPNVEFYTGSVDKPAGPRIFLLGNGSDNKKDAKGNKIYTYFNYSKEMKQVFLKEVARITKVTLPKPLPGINITFKGVADKNLALQDKADMLILTSTAEGVYVPAIEGEALKITGTKGAWDWKELKFKIDATKGVDVTANPFISFDVKSNVAISQFTFRFVTVDGAGWSKIVQVNVPAGTEFKNYKVELTHAILDEGKVFDLSQISEIHFILHGATLDTKSIVYIDNLVLGKVESAPTKLQAILYVTPPTKIDATTGEYADQPVMDFLTAAGYKVIPFGVSKLQNATQAQIDSLNSAALIILGRGVTSGDFAAPSKQKWNAITSPILCFHPYAVRTSKLNWFKTVDADASNTDSSFNFTFKANIDKPTDPVFAGLTSPISWATGPYSILKVKIAGNGTILASSEKDQSVLFVRFEPNVRFYADSADIPAGPRTYMGNGSDNKSDAAGNKIYNYLNFTTEGRQVFLKEVARMSGLIPTPVPAAEALVSKAATSPVLDGKIDDKAWSDANQYDIKRAFKGDIFANSADLRGYWKATFDDKGIYVMVNVTKDDVHYTDGTLGQAWEKDIIGVYFDMNPTLKDGGFPGGGTWDGHNGGHYQIELKEKTNPGSFSAWCAGCQVKITYDSTATNTSAIQELFVPWTSIPSKDNVVYKPSTTQPIGFDVYLSDNDGGKNNTPARRRLVWSNIGTVNENYNYMDDAGTMSFKIELPPAPSNEASITKASVTPVIDGIMDDKAWTAATQYNVDKPFTGDKFASTADLAGYWKATYDDNGIYVLVNVTNDDIHYTDGTLGQAWEKDITGIYFDMNSVFKDGKGTKDNVGHYQIELKEKANFGSLPTWCTGCQNKFTVDSTAKNTSIVQELFVPWTAIPSKDKIVYTPSSAQPIGFDVYLSDNDGGANTTPARRRLVWSNEGKVNEDYSNMDDAGTIKFADAGIPTVYTVLPITKVVFGKVDDAVDYKGDVSIRWDKDSVYMIYTVADEKIVNTGASYQVDNLEIYFDIDNSKNIHYPRNGGWLQAVDVAYDANDWQLRLVPDVAFATNNTARPSITEGYKHVYKATATGYTFNLNVAWSVLMKDFAPAVGKKIGFDVLLSDNDATASDANRNQITWNSPTGNPYNDPSLFGTLELTDNGLFKIITDTEKPKAPANVVATVTESDVKLTWDPATDNIVVQQYIVYQGSTAMDPILAKKADNTVTIKALANGDYSFTVAAVDVYGNTSAKSAAASAKIAVGINKINISAVNMYPNPAKKSLYLNNIKSDKAIIYFYNSEGQMVLSRNITAKNAINIASLRSGIYFIKVIDARNMMTGKLIKE